MKNFMLELVRHPLSFGMIILSVAATADITVCTIERARMNRAVRKGEAYQGSDYQGIFVKQKLPKIAASK